jgi:hypothetical protein
MRLALVFLVLIISSCSTKIGLNEVVKVDNVIKVQGAQLIDKTSKYTIAFSLLNLHEEPILLHLSEIQCFKGPLQGRVEHALFGAGERKINLRVRQMKNFRLNCVFGGEPAEFGAYKLQFGRIFENQGGDGVSEGKVLVESLDFVVPAFKE